MLAPPTSSASPRSGFGDGMGHTLEKTELESVLKAHGVTDVFVGGASPWARPMCLPADACCGAVAALVAAVVCGWRRRRCTLCPAPAPPISQRLALAGLALDYCVAFTCKDAVRAGFNTFLVKEATRGIAPDSMERELREMREMGVHILESADDVPTRDIDEALRKGLAGGAVASHDSVGIGIVPHTP